MVKNGVMYVTTGEQEIFALNAKTGNALIWEYRTPTDPKTGDNKAKRGVALGEGMVFGVESDIRQPAPKEGRAEPLTRLFALDQKTGKTVWKVELGADVPKDLRQYVAIPPLYYKGLVYMSISGGDGGLRGRLTAHDAKTGKEVWRWYAVPGPGEFGHDTWEGDSWKTGGGAIWVQPAIDPDLRPAIRSAQGTRGPTITDRRVPATICSPIRWSRWTPRRENIAGIIKPSITTCGTLMCRRP